MNDEKEKQELKMNVDDMQKRNARNMRISKKRSEMICSRSI